MEQSELVLLVKRLRAKGTDDATVEVKACAHELSKDLWRSVSAFANTHGGTLLLGLDESNGFAPVSAFDLRKVEQQVVSGLGNGDPSGVAVEPCPPYQLNDTLSVDGKPVLVIRIDELEGGAKPCFVKRQGLGSGSYKRIGEQDIRLSPREIYSFETARIASNADREPVPDASMASLDGELVDGLFRNMANARMFKGAKSNEDRLERANVIDQEHEVTLAGLLTCGSYPQQFYPKLLVDVAVHSGTNKADPTSSRRFLDRVICEGATGEMIDDAYRAVARNLHTYSVIQGSGRRDELEIPPDVIREAIANAVVHREYDPLFLGQSIQVDIYSDRIEIISPGGLWGGKTLENLDDGTSECRNASLMKLMSRVPSPGTEAVPVEGNGSGIKLMRRAMADRALRKPEFDPGIDYFKVTLRRAGAELSESQRWLRGLSDRAFSPHEEAVASILRRVGTATVTSVRGQIGIDSDEIRAAFSSLIDEGVAVSEGRDRIRLSRRAKDVDVNQERLYWSKTDWNDHIRDVLDRHGAMTAVEIADALGRRKAITETHLREMLESGMLVSHKKPGTRGRLYELAPKLLDV